MVTETELELGLLLEDTGLGIDGAAAVVRRLRALDRRRQQRSGTLARKILTVLSRSRHGEVERDLLFQELGIEEHSELWLCHALLVTGKGNQALRMFLKGVAVKGHVLGGVYNYARRSPWDIIAHGFGILFSFFDSKLGHAIMVGYETYATHKHYRQTKELMAEERRLSSGDRGAE